MTKLQELGQELDVRSRKALELITTGTPEAMTEAAGIDNECKSIVEQINSLKAADAMKTRMEEHRRMVEEPADDGFRHANPSGKALVTGEEPDGETIIRKNKRGDFEITSYGGGNYKSSKQYQALKEDNYVKAWGNYLRGGERRLDQSDFKTLQEGIDDQGGYLVPPQYVTALIQREPTPTSVNPHVTHWNTVSDAMLFPRLNYTGATDDPNAVLYSSGVRVTYPGEIPATSTTIDTTDPAFGEFRVDVHNVMMALSLTRNQLEDSVISVMQIIGDKFGETVDLEWDNRILNGTGVGQAHGILKNPTSSATGFEPQYITIGTGGVLTADGIEKLMFALAPQYVRKGRFIFNWQSTAQAISLLKDGVGRYLWSAGVQDSGLTESVFDRRLLGFPVSYTEFMPNVGASKNPMIFGDLTGYYLVQRMGMSIQVLDQTKAKQNQVEIVGRIRFGGGVAESYKMKVGQVAA